MHGHINIIVEMNPQVPGGNLKYLISRARSGDKYWLLGQRRGCEWNGVNVLFNICYGVCEREKGEPRQNNCSCISIGVIIRDVLMIDYYG